MNTKYYRYSVCSDSSLIQVGEACDLATAQEWLGSANYNAGVVARFYTIGSPIIYNQWLSEIK